MRPSFFCALLLFLTSSLLPVSAAKWLVVAVPQGENQVLDLARPFQVLFTNRTAHDLTVWNEGCSKGYFNLSFEFTGKDGKVIKVERNPNVDWKRNVPSGVIVQPGCDYAMTVNFGDKNSAGKREWMGAEALRGSMKMTTIYQNANTGFPVAAGKKSDPKQKPPPAAWIGQVKSDPIRVTIKR